MQNKLLLNERYIEIQCSRGDVESQLLALSIPYVHKNRIGTVFRTTTRNIDIVLKTFRNIDVWNIDTAPQNVQKLFEIEMHKRINTKTLLELGPTRQREWRYIHQQLGVEISEVHSRFAFFYDTRTGKTPMSLKIIADDVERNPHHHWLVLCPLILIENAWLPDAETFFPHLSVVNLHDTKRAARLAKYKLPANLYISNIESFYQYIDYIKQLPIHGCFVDESSAMKSHSSVFSELAVKYGFELARWYLLSGAPAPNGEWEYYRQIQSVDFYGIHQSWSQFKNYFFNDISRTPQYEKLVNKPERQQELTDLLRRYSLYVDKEDVLTTPGREFIEYEIQMPAELQEYYNKFKRELYLEIVQSGESIARILANGAGGKLNKLNQISSGFIMHTEAIKANKIKRKLGISTGFEEEAYELSDFKLKALDRILSNIGDEQCIIWANYHEEFDALSKHLGNKCGLVYGKVDITEKNKTIRNFIEGRIQYLVANPASADKGLTFTNAHFNIYYSLNYSYELWKQSIERIYGDISKQKNKCFYYILLAKGTVDEVIYDTIQYKGDMSKAMLEHLKGSFLRR